MCFRLARRVDGSTRITVRTIAMAATPTGTCSIIRSSPISDSVYHFTIPLADRYSTLTLAFSAYLPSNASLGIDNVSVVLLGAEPGGNTPSGWSYWSPGTGDTSSPDDTSNLSPNDNGYG